MAFEIELNAEAQQERLVILPKPGKDGFLKTRDGRRILYDAQSQQKILKSFKARRLDIPVCVGHRMSWQDDAEAVGWFSDLQAEPHGALSAKVEWTEQGRELIDSKQFKYLSPELTLEEGSRRIVMIRNYGMVNIPNLYIQELNEERPMSEKDKQTEQAAEIAQLKAEKEALSQALQAEQNKAFQMALSHELHQAKEHQLLAEGEEVFLQGQVQSEEGLSALRTMMQERQAKQQPQSTSPAAGSPVPLDAQLMNEVLPATVPDASARPPSLLEQQGIEVKISHKL